MSRTTIHDGIQEEKQVGTPAEISFKEYKEGSIGEILLLSAGETIVARAGNPGIYPIFLPENAHHSLSITSPRAYLKFSAEATPGIQLGVPSWNFSKKVTGYFPESRPENLVRNKRVSPKIFPKKTDRNYSWITKEIFLADVSKGILVNTVRNPKRYSEENPQRKSLTNDYEIWRKYCPKSEKFIKFLQELKRCPGNWNSRTS